MSFAIRFVRFRERQVKGDTIPKPVGLGSGGPLGPCLSGRGPASVRGLSGPRPALVQHRFRTVLIEFRV
jgi:hypothetical protein